MTARTDVFQTPVYWKSYSVQPWQRLSSLNTIIQHDLSRRTTKPTMCAQWRLRSTWASAQSDQSSLCAQHVVKGPMFLHEDREDSDLTGRMPRLIWVLAVRTGHFVGFVMRRLYCDASKRAHLDSNTMPDPYQVCPHDVSFKNQCLTSNSIK